jgi:hypothetical protein
MPQLDLFRSPPRPWNSGRIIGPKPPFKPKHVWAIRQQLKSANRVRDLALFDCGIDAKLRMRLGQTSRQRRGAGRLVAAEGDRHPTKDRAPCAF